MRRNRRKRRYALLAVAGTILAFLGVSLSIFASYYASPRLSNSTALDLPVKGERSIVLNLPGATGEKVYYFLDLESSTSFTASLAFRAGGTVLWFLDVGSATTVSKEGVALLERAPTDAVLTIRCKSCIVKGSLKVRYSSVDYDYLLALNVVAVAFSFTGLFAAAYGAFSFTLPKRTERSRRLRS